MTHEIAPGQQIIITNETPGEVIVKIAPMQSSSCIACGKIAMTWLRFTDLPEHPGIPLCITHWDNLKAVGTSGQSR